MCGALFDCGFYQVGLEPTRFIDILDLVFVNDPFIVNNISVECPIGDNDHNTVNFDLLSVVVNRSNGCDNDNRHSMVYDFN